MKNFSPEAKHAILLEYQSRSHTHSLPALARRHGVLGGARTIRNWLSRWNGTIQSLRPHPKPGRPSALSEREIREYIRAPILAKNKAHEPIYYTTVARQLRQELGKKVSTCTVRRIGREILKAKHKRTLPAEERERK